MLTPKSYLFSALFGAAVVMFMTAVPAHAALAPLETPIVETVKTFNDSALGTQNIQTAQKKISASEAKSIARRKVPGAKVVDISRNGNVYKVRLLRKDGRVVDVYVDATTGRVRS